MNIRNLIGAMAVAGLALTPSGAFAHAPRHHRAAARVDDGALKSRIEARLKRSKALNGSNIDVAVDHGVATLTGTVHSEAQSLRARSLAKVPGVTNVENKLTVDSKTTRAMDKAGDKTDRAMDKTAARTDRAADRAEQKAHKADDKADRAAARSKNAGSDVGEEITDGWITTKVKAGFLNEDPLKGSDINVDTNNHVVTLKGTVTSAAGRARAVAIAKSTKGVTRVVDALTIAPAK